MTRSFVFSLLIAVAINSYSFGQQKSDQQNFYLPNASGSQSISQAGSAYNAWFSGSGGYEPSSPYLQPYEPSAVYSPGFWQDKTKEAAQDGGQAGGGSDGGESGGEEEGGGGAGDAVNPGAPLSQIQFQNIFIPESYNSTGYANQFIIQPVFSINLKPDCFFDTTSFARRFPF